MSLSWGQSSKYHIKIFGYIKRNRRFRARVFGDKPCFSLCHVFSQRYVVLSKWKSPSIKQRLSSFSQDENPLQLNLAHSQMFRRSHKPNEHHMVIVIIDSIIFNIIVVYFLWNITTSWSWIKVDTTSSLYLAEGNSLWAYLIRLGNKCR